MTKGDRRRQAAKANVIDRLPPHAPGAEMGLLSCLMWDPVKNIPLANLRLAGVEDFYDLRHRTIYESVNAVFESKGTFDFLLLEQHLKDRQLLDQIGGIAYLGECQDASPSGANIQYYLDIIVEKAMLRELLTSCTTIAGRVYEDTDFEQLLSASEMAMLQVRAKRDTGRGAFDLIAVQNELVRDYELALNGEISGMPTGFTDLDRKCNRLNSQEMIILAAYPSAGKTTLAMNIAFHNAELGTPVSIHSLETSRKKLVHRLNCSVAHVNGMNFLNGTATESDMQRMVIGIGRVNKIKDKLIIHDEPMTGSRLIASCRRDYQAGARLFIIDYLQLIDCGGRTEYENVTNASKTVKMIAKELNVPVICISSLSRPEKGKVNRPTMNDLRASGQIEFDADKILLLHTEQPEAALREVEVNVAKNKDGDKGRLQLTMFASHFRFESVALTEPDYVPGND